MNSPPGAASNLAGKRLYQPGVLLAYFALGGLPCGLFLYGLNVARRGQPWVGYLLSAVATATFMLFAAAPAGTGRLSGSGFATISSMSLGILGFLVGIGVFKSESGPHTHRAAVARGATPAPWWPPAVAAIAVLLAVELSRAVFATGAP